MEELDLLNKPRREFLETALKATFAGVVIQIVGCNPYGSSSSADYPPGSAHGTISGNHGHIAFVTAAQLNTGIGVTLDIQGSANHTHSVVLSDSDVANIVAGVHVATTSSSADGGNGSHSHGVTFN